MRKQLIWLLVSGLVVLSLIAASCKATTPTTGGEEQVVKGEVVQTETPKTETKQPPTPAAEVPKVPVSGWLADTKTPTTAVGEPVYGGTVYVDMATDWQVFDNYRYAGNSQYYCSYVIEKLTIGDWNVDRNVFNFPDDSGKTPEAFSVPLLLSGWEFPDPLTIIMKVREGIRWQNKSPVNGRTFDADDIVWNLERSRGSAFIEKAYFNLIESVTKIDKMTVKVTLKPPARPYAQFGLIETDSNFFIPKETVEAGSNQVENWRKVIGTGPFMVQDFVPGSSVTYIKNPDYWRKDERHPANQLPYVDSVRVAIMPDLATRVAAFRVGKTDRVVGYQWKEAQSIKQSNPDALVRSYPANSQIVYRMRNDKPPFTDIRVRNAMQMAINLEEVRDTFYQGYAYTYSPAVTFVHANLYTPFDKLPESVKKVVTYNPKGAKALLAEAGYPKGFKTDLVYNVLQNPGLAEVVQSYLAAIGVEVELKPQDLATFNSIRLGKQHQGMLQHWNWNSPDPLLQLNVQADPTHIFNLSVANDPEFKELVAKINTEFDEAKRNELIRKANYMTLEKSFYITMPQGFLFVLWHPWLRGYTGETTIGNFQYGQVLARLWVDRDMKAKMTGR